MHVYVVIPFALMVDFYYSCSPQNYQSNIQPAVKLMALQFMATLSLQDKSFCILVLTNVECQTASSLYGKVIAL